MDRIVLALIIGFMLSGCGTRRCTRFYDKHPECYKADTTVTYDTIITEKINFDTTFLPTGEIDTFYIEKDKVKTMIIRQRDTLLVTQTIEPDTIIQTRTLIRDKIISKPKFPMWTLLVIIGLIIMLWQKITRN